MKVNKNFYENFPTQIIFFFPELKTWTTAPIVTAKESEKLKHLAGSTQMIYDNKKIFLVSNEAVFEINWAISLKDLFVNKKIEYERIAIIKGNQHE